MSNINPPAYDQLLDTSGERCPKPVLKARAALKQLRSGQVLKVIATDPQAPEDFAIFCQLKKLTYQQIIETTAGKYTIFITQA